MEIKELLKMIGGIQTIKSVMEILDVDKNKAIYYVYRLRKKGYVKTRYSSDKRRVYHISSENVLGGQSYIDIINKYSSIKLASSEVYKIYGRKISIEETIIYAVKTKRFRYILASLALFKKVKNWSLLYQLAKKNYVIRQVGALYDVAKKTISQVKRMHKGFRIYGLPKSNEPYISIIPDLQSSDFKAIEKVWRVHIPFNTEDLEDYKR